MFVDRPESVSESVTPVSIDNRTFGNIEELVLPQARKVFQCGSNSPYSESMNLDSGPSRDAGSSWAIVGMCLDRHLEHWVRQCVTMALTAQDRNQMNSISFLRSARILTDCCLFQIIPVIVTSFLTLLAVPSPFSGHLNDCWQSWECFQFVNGWSLNMLSRMLQNCFRSGILRILEYSRHFLFRIHDSGSNTQYFCRTLIAHCGHVSHT